MLNLSWFKFLRKKTTRINLDEKFALNEMPLFEISLSKTMLSFRNPPASFDQTSEYRYYIDTDQRPFVNTRTQSEYNFYPGMINGSYGVYNTAWAVFNSQKDAEAIFILRLSIDLLTPSDSDCERFDNLFKPAHLQSWLQKYYTHQNAVKHSSHMQVQENGGLLIELGDPDVLQDNIVADDSPVSFKTSSISGLPVLIPDVDAGSNYYCMPVSHRDVLGFCFSVSSLDILNESTNDGMIISVQSFIENMLESVKISVSDEEKLWVEKAK